MLTKDLKKHAEHLGADLTGIAPVERFKHAPFGARPTDLLPGARYVFVFGIWHGDTNLDVWDMSHNPYGFLLTHNNILLNLIASRLSVFVEKRGHRALVFPVTALHARTEYDLTEGFCQGARVSDFSHRHAAVAAGLGEFGWSSMLLTPEYGPRVRVNSVITDAPLESDEMYRGSKLCTDCQMCVDTCPMNAISNKKMVKVDFGERTYEYAQVDFQRCRWAEMGHMNPESNSWSFDTYPPPEKITYKNYLLNWRNARNPWDLYQPYSAGCGRCIFFCESRRGKRGGKLEPRKIPSLYRKSVLYCPGGMLRTITKEEVAAKSS
jgi:ferredoxin